MWSIENNLMTDYRGLSTDTKPVDGLYNGSTFLEMDTGAVYCWNADSNEWVLQPAVHIDPADISDSVETWLDNHPEATTTVEDGSITYAKLHTTMQEKVDDINDLKNAIEDILLTKVLTDAQKNAILACFRNVAWINDQGQTYYEALQDAFNVSVSSISAVYTQSGTVYDTQTLDDLRQNLVVTATMSDGTTSAVEEYTLSGNLTAGTRTITVSYSGKTTTFNVTVTHMQGSIVSISAVFDSSATITTDNSIEDLRQYLTVTAHYDNDDDVVVTGYTLSGSLNVGQNTITVTYSDKTTTFNVNVIEAEHITATFNASGNTIYTDDSLDSLKQYLVVTYYAAGESTGTVISSNDYTLSGSLVAGASTITVSYSGTTTTFVVNAVDYYDIHEWSVSNGLLNIVQATIINRTDGNVALADVGSSANRRTACTTKGEHPLINNYTGEETEWYAIPVPSTATRFTVGIQPETQFTGARFWKFNETTQLYESIQNVGWKQGEYSGTLNTTGEDIVATINTKYDSAGSSYPTLPTNIYISFT